MNYSHKFNRRTILAGATAAGLIVPTLTSMAGEKKHKSKESSSTDKASGTDVNFDKMKRVKVDLVAPPFVHEHEQIASDEPKIVEFTLNCEEKKIVIDDDGTEIWAMTFNGTVPGPLLVVHEGDYVEVTLNNPTTNTLTHNIDFHASTGAMGGGDITVIEPGQKVVFRFKADRPGTFVYHCAAPGMVPWHVTSGMNGAIMVLPRKGLTDPTGKPLKYDRIYYIGEQDFYVPKDENGKYKSFKTVEDGFEDTSAVMRTLLPSHVVFNGAVGALTGDKALKAKVGETVLFVHSQANRDTRPHLIGGHGDYVWESGKFNNPPLRDMETWFIPGGAAAAALYHFKQPGRYVYLNHDLIEAFELGAAAHVKVEGEWNDNLMKQVLKPSSI